MTPSCDLLKVSGNGKTCYTRSEGECFFCPMLNTTASWNNLITFFTTYFDVPGGKDLTMNFLDRRPDLGILTMDLIGVAAMVGGQLLVRESKTPTPIAVPNGRYNCFQVVNERTWQKKIGA